MRHEMHEVLPIGGVASDLITYLVPEASPSSGGWIDLKESYFHIRAALRIAGSQVDDVTNPLPASKSRSTFNPKNASEAPSPETAFAHALWRRFRTFLGSVEVSDEDGGFAWWQAFVRDALTEEPGYGNSSCNTMVVSTAPYVPSQIPPNPIELGSMQYEYSAIQTDGWTTFTVYGGSTTDAGNYPTGAGNAASHVRATLQYRISPSFVESASTQGANIVEIIYKPKCGIWNTQYLLPPNTSLRCELEKSPAHFPFRTPRIGGQMDMYVDWEQSSMRLYLARKFPERAVAEALAAESLQNAFMYPFVRARTHISTQQGSTTSVDITGLLAGPRPDLVVIGVVDNKSLQKPTVVDGADNQGGSQFSAYQCSGAGRPFSMVAPGFNAGELWSAPPLVTEAQVRWGGRSVPLVPYRQPTAMEIGRAYEEYRRVSKGALSYGDFQGSYSLYCFDLTDSGSAKESMEGRFSDMGDGDRGSLEVHLQLAPNENTQPGSKDNGTEPRSYTVIVTGFGTAAAAISPATGTVRRLGF
jgi:hypothetical protein